MGINDRRFNSNRIYERKNREELSPDRSWVTKRKRTILFELTLFQFFILLTVCLISFVWMFSLGLTLGRQFPEEESKQSLLQKVAVALGYRRDRSSTAKTKSDGEKSTPPSEMQLALTYHNELSKPLVPGITSSQTMSSSKTAGQPKQQRRENPQPQKEPASPQPQQIREEREKETTKPEPSPTTTVESTGEKYTVLVASFRSGDNAGRLEQMLRSKGYIVSRQETVIRNETWHRVMVGNFDSRESAQRFTAMFNEKEGLKGVVIRK